MNLFQQLYNTADSLIGAFNGDPEVVHFGVMQARTIALFYFLLRFLIVSQRYFGDPAMHRFR